jgi:hypothetical protein
MTEFVKRRLFSELDYTGLIPAGSSIVTTISPGGTTNYIPKFTPSGVQLGDSILTNVGTNVGIGTASLSARLHILTLGNSSATNSIRITNSSSVDIFNLEDAGHLKVSANADNYIEWDGEVGGLFTAFTNTATVSGFKAQNNAAYFRLASGNGQHYLSTTDYFDFYIGDPTPVGVPTTRFATNGNVGIGTGAGSIDTTLLVVGSFKNTTGINSAGLPTSNAGLSTGDFYVSTAATILANGDKVVGWKV